MKKIFIFICALVACHHASAQSSGAVTFYNTNYASILKTTPYGYIISKKASPIPAKTAKSVGADYVHIFVDENGDLISRSLPSGVAWIYYVVHVVYPDSPTQSYNVVQTSGSISGAFIVQNATAAAAAPNPGPGGPAPAAPNYTENVFVVGPSDNASIGFQIIKTVTSGVSSVKTTIATYTLPISGYYNASIDVGFFNSKLHNPTYTLVNSPITSGGTVVKAAEAGDRMMTTVMATLYFSPVVFAERLLDKDNVPLFKVKGRSAVADHGLLERIYPAVGLSVNEKTFENIFYGLNWEMIRGGSVFVGFHTGKINTYTNSTAGFAYGVTPVNQDQFNYQTDTKWATKFAFGATIDLRVVTGLLSTQVK
ncbi:MAG TPA: hypothetical protein VHS53_11205 [Mucilaginibacter sp.]|nr:hypothetical protein [Mucilaginibacter sp.]